LPDQRCAEIFKNSLLGWASALKVKP